MNMFEEKFKSAMDKIQPSNEALDTALAACRNGGSKFTHKTVIHIAVVCCLVVSISVMIFAVALNSSSETVQDGNYLSPEHSEESLENIEESQNDTNEPGNKDDSLTDDVSQDIGGSIAPGQDYSMPTDESANEGTGIDISDTEEEEHEGIVPPEVSEELELPSSASEPELPEDSPTEGTEPTAPDDPSAEPDKDNFNVVKLVVKRVTGYAFSGFDSAGNMYEVNYSAADTKLSSLDVVYVSYKDIENVYDSYLLSTDDELWGYEESGNDAVEDSPNSAETIIVITALKIEFD